MTFGNSHKPSFVNGETDFSASLHELSNAIQVLSLRTAASDALECRQFKKEQLINLVNGNFTPLEEVNPLPQDLALSRNMNSLSHLGMISARSVHCDYSEVYEHEFKSLLDLHVEEDSWCVKCASQKDKQIDLKNGKINQFSCWRRSQDSGHLGFLLRGKIFYANNQVSMRVEKIGCSKKLVAQSLGSQKLRSASVEREQVIPGTSMICTFTVDMKQDKSSDELLEVEGLLGQQLLFSKNLKFKQEAADGDYRLRSEKVPSFLARLIKSTHQKWHLGGPSKHTLGVLSVILINHENQFVETSSFTTPLMNICLNQRPKIDFQMYQYSDLNEFSKQHLCIDETIVPLGSYMIVFVLDPLVDFGGVAIDQ
jgi:hypothetical protein